MAVNEQQRERRPADQWGDVRVPLGESRDLDLTVGESYSGMMLRIPVHVRRAPQDGPVVFVTAALHGDEVNGTGAIRTLIQDRSLKLVRGTLILVPVLNILGFDRHSRYLPDRRDLNRCFPGSPTGSLARRMAYFLFDELVRRADYGIDLHTAAVRRTNFPNVRGDLELPEVERLAKAFGSEVIIKGRGPAGALRREACQAGCPTIILEGGEVWKVEPTIVDCAVQGVRNVLAELGMIDQVRRAPLHQMIIDRTKWVRADRGGFLQFHVAPGDVVANGDPLATNTTLLGRTQNVLHAPFDGVVVGLGTLPAVSPGEPVCNLGEITPEIREKVQRLRAKRKDTHLQERLLEDLATNVTIVDAVLHKHPRDGSGNANL